MIDMKPLELKIIGKGEKKGYSLSQIKAGLKSYIYEVFCIETKSVHYEVLKHRENAKYGCISYPNSKSFGIWAWTFGSLELAMNKFNKLEQ